MLPEVQIHEMLSEQNLSDIFNNSKQSIIRAVEIKKANKVSDSPALFKLYFLSQKSPFGVIHLSPTTFPDSMGESYEKTLSFHSRLGDKSRILVPRFCSTYHGCTYTYTKYLSPIRAGRLGTIQRKIIRKDLLGWLSSFRALEEEVNTDLVHYQLTELYKTENLTPEIKAMVSDAIDALGQQWNPKHIPDHNDLWYGNVLTETDSIFSRDFFIIDCGGANNCGYGVNDMLTASISFGYRPKKTAFFVDKFIKLNNMTKNEVIYQYLAGAAHLRQNLNQFPIHRFLQKITTNYQCLKSTLRYIR